MRIRLLVDCRVNKVLAEIGVIIVVLNKANKVSLMRWLIKDFNN